MTILEPAEQKAAPSKQLAAAWFPFLGDTMNVRFLLGKATR